MLGTGEAGCPDCRKGIEVKLDGSADRMVHDAPAHEIIRPDGVGHQDETVKIDPGRNDRFQGAEVLPNRALTNHGVHAQAKPIGHLLWRDRLVARADPESHVLLKLPAAGPRGMSLHLLSETTGLFDQRQEVRRIPQREMPIDFSKSEHPRMFQQIRHLF